MLAYISALNCSHSYIFDFEICLDRWEFGFDFSFGAHDLCIVFKIHMMTIRFMNMAADLFDDDLN